MAAGTGHAGGMAGLQKGAHSSNCLVVPPIQHHVASPPAHVTGNINATYRIHPKMFNQPRYLKNKSIKKVSPKTRRTAELYKSSHNIGNRTAAERVGSYKETEVALVYPEGFWEAVKIDDGSPRKCQSRSPSRSPKSSPRSHSNEMSPTRSTRRTQYSPCALPVKKPRNSDSTSSDSAAESSGADSETGMKDAKVNSKKTADSKAAVSKLRRGGASSSRECSEERNHASPPKKTSKSTKKSNKGDIWPRAPRIKRTACLNAAAIVGLLYENDEPSHKKRKVEVQVEVDVDSDSSVDSEDAYDTYYEVQFDRDLKKALAASLEDSSGKHKKGASNAASAAVAATNDKDCTNSKASCDSSSKKSSSPKDKECKYKRSKDKDKDKDKEKGKETKRDNKDSSSKEKKTKKPGKDKEKQVKAKKEPAVKKVVSKKVKKTPKEVPKKGVAKASKKDVRKVEHTSGDSESSESEEETKPEHEVPLWPPPKRMASLNATAILAASKEPRKPTLERAARIVIYVKAKKDVLPRKPKTVSYRGTRIETGRWVQGMGTAEIESNQNYDPYAFHDSPVEVAVVEEERNVPSPDIQVLSVESGSPRPIPPSSPDVQIIEVVSQPPSVENSPNHTEPNSYSSPTSRQPPPHGVPVPAHQVVRKNHHSSPPQHAASRVTGSQMQTYPPAHPSQVITQRTGHHAHPSQQHPHHRMHPLPAHHTQASPHLSTGPYYHHAGKTYASPTKPFVSLAHHAAHHNMPAQPLPPLAQPQHHPQHHQHSPYHHSALTQGGSGGGTPPQGPPPPAHQPNPIPHRPPSIKSAYDDTGSTMIIDRMPTPTQTPPVAQAGYQTSTHGYVHQSGPMGNTCTYPYPHSGGGGGGGGGGNGGGGGGGSGAAGAAGPAGGPQNSHCQGFPFGSMGSVSSYHMMAACHSRPFSSAFSVPSFNHSIGYYPADGLMDPFGETTCCVPLSYHIHQQQVKVLVHNTAIPPYPTGPNPYHHQNHTPTVTLIPDPPPAGELSSPDDKKPLGSGNLVVCDTSGQDVASSPGEISPGSNSVILAHRKYVNSQEGESETASRTYKPEWPGEGEHSSRGEERGGGGGGGGEDGGVTYKTEHHLSLMPHSHPSPLAHQGLPHKEEKIDVTDDGQSPTHSTTIAIAEAPLLLNTLSTAMASISPQEVLTAKVEKRSPDTVSHEAAKACPKPAIAVPEHCKREQCPSPLDVSRISPQPPATQDAPLPQPIAEQACAAKTEQQQEHALPAVEQELVGDQEEEQGEVGTTTAAAAVAAAKRTINTEANTDLPSQDDKAQALGCITVDSCPADLVSDGPQTGTSDTVTDKAVLGDTGVHVRPVCEDEKVDKEGQVYIVDQTDKTEGHHASIEAPLPGVVDPPVAAVSSLHSSTEDIGNKNCVRAEVITSVGDSVVSVVDECVHDIINSKLSKGKREGEGDCGKAGSTTTRVGVKRIKASHKANNSDLSKSSKLINSSGKGFSTAIIVNALFKSGKGSSSKLDKSGKKLKSLKSKSQDNKKKQLYKLKKSKLKKSKNAKKPKVSKKSKLKKVKGKSKDTTLKIKFSAFRKTKVLNIDATTTCEKLKQTSGKKSPKKDTNGDSSCKCAKKGGVMIPPKVKVELCSPTKIRIKKEREESASPKPMPSPKQLPIDTSSPKLATFLISNGQGNSFSPKRRKFLSVSPKLRRENSISPKLYSEISNSPKLRRENSVSPKLRRECSISPKIRRDSPINPKLHRETSSSPKIRRECSVSPKIRCENSASPKLKRETSSSPKQSKRDETSSPKSITESHSNTSSPRSTSSPKIRYRDQIPTNKVLRVHVEPLNSKSSANGPKPAVCDTCSPKCEIAVSPCPGSPLSPVSSIKVKTKEDDRRVMLGPRKMVPTKRSQASNSGWHWEGAPYYNYCQVQPQDSPPVRRKYYKAIRYKDGDVIQVRDCVLVRSGLRKKDIPYVAKIGDFWEAPESGEMMMSIMWYYRPEQAESDRLPRHVTAELFASKHKDEASIACIDDKCFVLTFNEFCRYKSHQKQIEQGFKLHTKLVPAIFPSMGEPPPKRQRIPRFNADPETVFVCRRVYDFKLKRILKNPTAN